MSSDDSSLFDEEYRNRMEEVLDETEYDTQLGLEMAEDAQRLVAGEISEAEFTDKYHEAVIEEFEEDNRGLDELVDDSEADVEDDASIPEKMQSLVEDGEYDRREVMKKGGAAAAAVGVGLSGSKSQESGGHGGGHGPSGPDNPGDAGGGDGIQYGMVINLNNCDGCLECVTACKSMHGTSKGSHWLYVMAYEEPGRDTENDYFVRPCMHCDEAPCEKVCPVGARHTREKDGLVLSDYEICIGCRYCQVSCPYGANHFQWGEPTTDPDSMGETFTRDSRGQLVDGPPPQGVMGKCTFEPSWQDGAMGEDLKGTVACEQACAMDAIHFGDMNDPESAPNQHLDEYKQAHQNDLSEFENRTEHTVSTFRPLEDKGTDPNVVYIGNEPGPYAKQVEGPVTYEEKGLVNDRKSEILDKGAAANKDGEKK